MYDHIGLKVQDIEASKRFYTTALAPLDKAGLAAGGKDNGKPGLRTEYSANYYGAFLIDSDGNNVEAVCFK